MPVEFLAEFFQRLTDDQVRALQEGRACVALDSEGKPVWRADGHEGDCLIDRQDLVSGTADDIRQRLVAKADELLDDHYRHRPLPRPVFDQALRRALDAVGWGTIASDDGRRPSHTVFVDGADLQVIGEGDPRHPYGIFLAGPGRGGEPAARVEAWISSGEAYTEYLASNTCRFGCAT